MTQSTVSGNTAYIGGGIYAEGRGANSVASVTLTDSTVSGNTGTYVSGVSATYGAALYNSTVSGNTTTVSGNTYSTALFIGSTEVEKPSFVVGGVIASLSHSHHASSAGVVAQAGKIQSNLYASSALILGSSIVSGNSSLFDIVATTATTACGGHNIIGIVNTNINLGSLTNEVAGNPLLSPLANNGCATPAGAPGSTACVQTMALQAGSPAINAGSDPLDLSTDERGVAFARVFGSAADIGAFEVQPAATTTAPVPIPTLSRWALLALLAQLGFAALYKLRQMLPRRPES